MQSSISTRNYHIACRGHWKKTKFSVSERKCIVVPNLMQSPCLLCSEVFKLVVYKNLTQLMHHCARIPPMFCTLALQVLPDSFVACLKNAIFSVTHKLGPCNPQCMQTKMEIWHAKRNFTFSQKPNPRTHLKLWMCLTDL